MEETGRAAFVLRGSMLTSPQVFRETSVYFLFPLTSSNQNVPLPEPHSAAGRRRHLRSEVVYVGGLVEPLPDTRSQGVFVLYPTVVIGRLASGERRLSQTSGSSCCWFCSQQEVKLRQTLTRPRLLFGQITSRLVLPRLSSLSCSPAPGHFFASPPRSITFHLISMKPQTTNI